MMDLSDFRHITLLNGSSNIIRNMLAYRLAEMMEILHLLCILFMLTADGSWVMVKASNAGETNGWDRTSFVVSMPLSGNDGEVAVEISRRTLADC